MNSSEFPWNDSNRSRILRHRLPGERLKSEKPGPGRHDPPAQQSTAFWVSPEMAASQWPNCNRCFGLANSVARSSSTAATFRSVESGVHRVPGRGLARVANVNGDRLISRRDRPA